MDETEGMVMGFILEIKDGENAYCLSNYNSSADFPLFLENQDNEGMSLSEKNLFDLLDKYFKEEF